MTDVTLCIGEHVMIESQKSLEDKHPDAVKLFRRFALLALVCGDDVVVSVSRTVVYFKRNRVLL